MVLEKSGKTETFSSSGKSQEILFGKLMFFQKTFTKELISLASSLSSLFFKTSLWSVKSRGNVQEFLL